MWKICSPSEASQFRTKPSATGVRRSVSTTHESCGAAEAGWATPGIWMKFFVTFQGRRQYLWRAVDHDGDVLDILVQSRRDRRAAARLFRKVLQGQGRSPRRLVTDKLRRYSAAHRTVMPSVIHSTRQYANNRAAGSHQPTRQRERQMRRFTSAAPVQRFLAVHGLVLNLFRVGRHLLRSAHHRWLRRRAFAEWDAVTGAC